MDQNWSDTVIGRKKAATGSTDRRAGQAMREGGSMSTEIKFDGGRNVQQSSAVYARKLDEAEDAKSLGHVGHDVSVRIQQARTAKGWTQKQLAQAISEKPGVINDYESGRGIPNPQVLSKIERALGTRVRPDKPRKGKGKY